MKKRHYAQVARFRIETAFIEFDAEEDDTDAAEKLAEGKGKTARQRGMVPGAIRQRRSGTLRHVDHR